MSDLSIIASKSGKGRSGWLWMTISLALYVLSSGGIHPAAAAAADAGPEFPHRGNVQAAPPAPAHVCQSPSNRQTRNRYRVKPAAIHPAIPSTTDCPIAVPPDLPNPHRNPGKDAEVGIGAQGGVMDGAVEGDAGNVIEGIPEGVPDQAPAGVREEPFYAGFGGVSDPELINSSRVPPRYPELARQAGVQGKVLVQAVIRKDGTVGNITILQSTGARLGFDAAAIEAVGRWRYKPGLQNGKPVDVYFTILVDFSPPH